MDDGGSMDSSGSDTETLNNDSTSGSDTATLSETADTAPLTPDETFQNPTYANDFVPVKNTDDIEEEIPAAASSPGASGSGSGTSIAALGYFLWASSQSAPPAELDCQEKPLWNKTAQTAFNGTVCQNHSGASLHSMYLLLVVFGFI